MTTSGYMVVCLHKNGRQRNHYVHRLVAEAFCDNKNGYNEINHKDENKQNNQLTNLEWCTREYNLAYGTRGLRQSQTMKEKRIWALIEW